VSGALVVGGFNCRGGGWGRRNSCVWFDHVFREGVEGAQALKELRDSGCVDRDVGRALSGGLSSREVVNKGVKPHIKKSYYAGSESHSPSSCPKKRKDSAGSDDTASMIKGVRGLRRCLQQATPHARRKIWCGSGGLCAVAPRPTP